HCHTGADAPPGAVATFAGDTGCPMSALSGSRLITHRQCPKRRLHAVTRNHRGMAVRRERADTLERESPLAAPETGDAIAWLRDESTALPGILCVTSVRHIVSQGAATMRVRSIATGDRHAP